MIIHSIELRNFLSHEDSRINFDVGVNLITGKNGSGKSSIIDGIKFALFGDSRGGSIADLVRNGSTETSVRLEFSIASDDYTLIRAMSLGRSGVKSRDATLERNGIEIARTVSAVNRAMEDILGITEDLFLNSVFVQQGEITSLVSENKSVRERTFSHILGLNFLQQLAQDIQDSTRELKGRIEAMSSSANDLIAATEKIENTQSEISTTMDAIKAAESMEGSLKAALDYSNKKFQEALETVRKIEADDGKRMDLKSKIENVRSELAEKKRRIGEMERRSLELNDHIDATLLGMQQRIQRYFDLTTMLGSSEKILQNLSTQVERYEKLNDEVKSLIRVHEKFVDLSADIEQTRNKVKSLEKHEESYLFLQNSLTQAKKRIQQLNEDISTIMEKIGGLFGPNADEEEINSIRNNLRESILRIDSRIAEIKADAGRINNERKKISSSLEELGSGSVCPLCKQPLTQDHMDRLISDYMNEDGNLIRELEKLSSEKTALEAKRNALSMDMERISSKDVQSYFSIKRRLISEIQEMSDYEGRIAETENYHVQYQNLRKNLDSLTMEYNEIEPLERRYTSLLAALSGIDENALRSDISRQSKDINTLKDERDDIEKELGFVPDAETKQRLQKSLNAELELSALRGKIEGEKAAERSIAARLEDLENDLKNLSISVSGLQAARQNLENAKRDLKVAEENWQNHISEVSSQRSKLEVLETIMETARQEKTAAEREVAQLEKLRGTIGKMDLIRSCFDRDGIQKTIRKDSAVYVTNMMREYSLAFNLNFEDIRVGEDMSIEVSQNGNVESIDMLSGGERTALAIALRLALVKYVNDSIKTMVMDEPTVFLDEDRRQNLTDILQYSFNGEEMPIPQMIIVSHHSELRSVSNNIFEVSKINGKSIVRQAE